MNATSNPFVPATRMKLYLKLLLEGPSGCGKTWNALRLAQTLAHLEGGKVAFGDTEGGASLAYAGQFQFDYLTIGNPYNPDDFIRCVKDAERCGYKVLVIDSASHEWQGVLNLKEKVEASTKLGSFGSWAVAKPKHAEFIDAVQSAKIHIIVTSRIKVDFEEYEQPNGKKGIRKVGTALKQNDEFEYEFALVGEIDADHNIKIAKTRYACVRQDSVHTDLSLIAGQLHDWLKSGDDWQPPTVFSTPLDLPPAPASKPASTPSADSKPAVPPAESKIFDTLSAASIPAETPPTNGIAVPLWDFTKLRAVVLGTDNLFISETELARVVDSLKTSATLKADHNIRQAVEILLYHQARVGMGFDANKVHEILAVERLTDAFINGDKQLHYSSSKLKEIWKQIVAFAQQDLKPAWGLGDLQLALVGSVFPSESGLTSLVATLKGTGVMNPAHTLAQTIELILYHQAQTLHKLGAEKVRELAGGVDPLADAFAVKGGVDRAKIASLWRTLSASKPLPAFIPLDSSAGLWIFITAIGVDPSTNQAFISYTERDSAKTATLNLTVQEEAMLDNEDYSDYRNGLLEIEPRLAQLVSKSGKLRLHRIEPLPDALPLA